ncbi:MAG: hypothetical protein K2X69_06355 [Silvanigrellaceae bacterium]|nr:hypothetical protein [Silvanigrellaceae bacterium]
MKQQLIQTVKYDSKHIEEPSLVPEYIVDSFVPISNIQKSTKTKNDNVLKLTLINIDVYVLKKDFFSVFSNL